MEYWKSKAFENTWCNSKVIVNGSVTPYAADAPGGSMFYDNVSKIVDVRLDGEHLGTYKLKGIKCRHYCPEEEEEEVVV
jgi:hypothetical protein